MEVLVLRTSIRAIYSINETEEGRGFSRADIGSMMRDLNPEESSCVYAGRKSEIPLKTLIKNWRKYSVNAVCCFPRFSSVLRFAGKQVIWRLRRRGAKMNIERYLIEYCSPTLASLKTASLFCFAAENEIDLQEQIQNWNHMLRRKGLLMLSLKRGTKQILIYVYRYTHLQADLAKPGVTDFLAEYGYSGTEPETVLNHLKRRLRESETFPHEIGIFLGYPLEDVEGFIRHKGQNCHCTGCWKVYGDKDEADKRFTQFRKCREIYARLWNQGRSVWQLTVAA